MHQRVLAPVGVVLVGVGIYLVFFVFAFHLIFIDDKVDEVAPVFASGAGTAVTEFDDVVDEDKPAEATATMADEEMAAENMAEQELADDELAVETLVSGDFIDRSHPTSGVAVVLSDGTGQRFLRFEDFRTDNGPDLDVYLSTADPDAPAGDFDDDFVSLGDLTGNIGDQNYEIPADVDLSVYRTVVIWCVRFSVAFGAAALA